MMLDCINRWLEHSEKRFDRQRMLQIYELPQDTKDFIRECCGGLYAEDFDNAWKKFEEIVSRQPSKVLKYHFPTITPRSPPRSDNATTTPGELPLEDTQRRSSSVSTARTSTPAAATTSRSKRAEATRTSAPLMDEYRQQWNTLFQPQTQLYSLFGKRNTSEEFSSEAAKRRRGTPRRSSKTSNERMDVDSEDDDPVRKPGRRDPKRKASDRRVNE
ncbi:unnamed protein product [Periconia digitata]|uniref:Uncharacterized protein n=1 Tax=Periconia digitata TaxID=1303443 RepID=A0A9W4UPM8_9PLEO|nr:unnamed protein product [Periconia digitata]